MRMLLAVLLVVMAVAPVRAQPQAQTDTAVTLMGTRLQGRLEDGGDFPYNRFIAEILAELPEPVAFGIFPPRRVINGFMRTDDVCAFPSNVSIALRSSPEWSAFNLVQSDPVDSLSAHFFVRQGEVVPRVPADLADKDVAYTRGLDFVMQFGVDSTRFYEAEGQRIYLRMLNEGRVDVIVGWVPGMERTVAEYGMTMPDYDPDWKLTTVPLHVVCKGTPKTAAFLESFNKALAIMKESGRLAEILGYEPGGNL